MILIMSSIEFTRWRSTERGTLPIMISLCNLGGKQILTFWLLGTMLWMSLLISPPNHISFPVFLPAEKKTWWIIGPQGGPPRRTLKLVDLNWSLPLVRTAKMPFLQAKLQMQWICGASQSEDLSWNVFFKSRHLAISQKLRFIFGIGDHS